MINKIIKHISKAFLVFALSLILVFTITVGGIKIHRLTLTTRYNFDFLNGQANKVILFVGDGMGENHIKVTETYCEKELFFTGFSKQGFVSTSSLDVLKSTDSASTATAFATGNKVHNGEISSKNHIDLPILTDFIKSLGYGVGLVTTDYLYTETVAAFSSHVDSKDNIDEIVSDQIMSNVDLFLGNSSSEYVNNKINFANQGYTFIDNFSNLKLSKSKIIGAFEEIIEEQTSTDSVTLDKVTDFAVDYMETNFSNGYLLIVECGHIDRMAHNSLIFEMIQYLDNFDYTISKTYEKLKNDSSCAIIVTGNHETGNLKYNGETKDEINSMNMILDEGHTLKDVPYFMTFTNNKANLDQISRIIDNTDIYKICKALMSK